MLAEVDPVDTDREGFHDAFCEWFVQDYPRVVGLVRRVIDPQRTTAASLAAAEAIVQASFGAHRWSLPTEDRDRDLTKVIGSALDRSIVLLDGHPGAVAASAGIATEVRLGRLHDVLRKLGRNDRRIGLLAYAGGFSPMEISLILERGLLDVTDRIAGVRRRIEQSGAASATVFVEGVR